MSKPLRIEEQVRYIYVAVQHLQHGRSTVDLATELGISRFTVGRMVQRARAEGLVEVRPMMHDPVDAELSAELANRFGLVSAVVVVNPVDRAAQARTAIASVAAKVVAELIEEDDVVGLSSGRTILEMCDQLGDLPTCDIVQLTGVATTDAGESLHAVTTLSSIAPGRMFPLHAPFVTTDAAAGRMIASQPAVKQALQRMARIDKAVLTIGGWPDSALLIDQIKLFGEFDEFVARGVVAEVGTALLDAEGNELPLLAGRTIGISTEQLRGVPVKIGVGGGPGKRPAIRATLKAGLVDILVTDANTARAVLAST